MDLFVSIEAPDQMVANPSSRRGGRIGRIIAPFMGQSVTVVAKSSSNPEILRFEINRSLTGMGHEMYSSIADVIRDRVVDVLATRIFEHGGVDSVHVNSSVITVRLAGGSTGEGLAEVIENLFRFYSENKPHA